jgi:hypothetical protein
MSEQMKAWAAALAAEMASWPQVRSCAFFGYTALYRGDKIFALLPRTRTLEVLPSVAFKLESPTSRLRSRIREDSRISSTQPEKGRWFTFELTSDDDLHDALSWLNHAHGAVQ